MIRRTLILSAVLAGLLAGSAQAATRTVSIRAAGFQPASLTLVPGDRVVWRNADTRSHQVVEDKNRFTSPVLAPGQTYSHRFLRAGTFAYHDALAPSRRGTIAVKPIAKTISVTRTGFVPDVVSVRVGSLVLWRNVDTRRHQVIDNQNRFRSPVLDPGETFRRIFDRVGTFRYHDGFNRQATGTIVVQPAPKPAAITLAPSSQVVVFGGSVTLSGLVTNGRADQTVTIWARPYGQGSYARIATLLTAAGGGWQYVAQPGILTSYQARFRTAESAETQVFVRPHVTLSVSRRYLSIRVRTARSLFGRYAVLQRLTPDGFWAGVSRYKLGRNSGRILRIPRQKRPTTYRAWISERQAGPGYVAGWSAAKRVLRRR